MKIFSVDSYGITYSVRILNEGTFKVILDNEILPERINKDILENLMLYGTTSGI